MTSLREAGSRILERAGEILDTDDEKTLSAALAVITLQVFAKSGKGDPTWHSAWDEQMEIINGHVGFESAYRFESWVKKHGGKH